MTEGQGLSLSPLLGGFTHISALLRFLGLCDDLLEQHGDVIFRREKRGGCGETGWSVLTSLPASPARNTSPPTPTPQPGMEEGQCTHPGE